jgi:hypothetical protein
MNKPIEVKAHLSIETIQTRYRKAKDPVERAPLAHRLAARAGQDDQRDRSGHRLLPGMDPHPCSSLQ